MKEQAGLFDAFDAAAAEHGWERLGQPVSALRRYGRGRETMRIYANLAGTGIVRVCLTWTGMFGPSVLVELGTGDRHKRQRALALLSGRRVMSDG